MGAYEEMELLEMELLEMELLEMELQEETRGKEEEIELLDQSEREE
jgi:hypothetical protein